MRLYVKKKKQMDKIIVKYLKQELDVLLQSSLLVQQNVVSISACFSVLPTQRDLSTHFREIFFSL